jgi:hypothetical protein
MTEHQTSRTLVKSAPELWAECSDAASLARHLGAFGEIRITKLEPETAVAWEGTAVRGTVRLEPSGWGTRVTLTMTEPESEPESEPEPEPEVAEVAEAEVEPATESEPAAPRPRLLARLLLALRRKPATDDEPASAPAPAAFVAEVAASPPDEPRVVPAGEDALAAALDSLGRAHHRPYSRA